MLFEGGKYIRRASLSCRSVIWVSGTEQLGLLLSHSPCTLAISVPLIEQEYIQDELSSLFIHEHAPRLLGNILVSTNLFVCQLAQQVITYIPLNLVCSKAWITTFCSRLHRQDNCYFGVRAHQFT